MGDEGRQPGGDGIGAEQGHLQQTGDEAASPDLKEGYGWGESITKGRAAELEAKLQAWEQEVDHSKREGPFDARGLDGEERMPLFLTGADVFWLAARALAGTGEAQAVEVQMDLMRRARWVLRTRYTIGLDLSGATLLHADLAGAFLRGTNFSHASLASANLAGADLYNVDLRGAYLNGANVSNATLVLGNLAGANLSQANLAGTDLNRADPPLVPPCTRRILPGPTSPVSRFPPPPTSPMCA